MVENKFIQKPDLVLRLKIKVFPIWVSSASSGVTINRPSGGTLGRRWAICETGKHR